MISHKKIRAEKDAKVSFSLTTNTKLLPLAGRQLQLIMHTPTCRDVDVPFTVDADKISFAFCGKQIGQYTFTVFENRNEKGATAVDLEKGIEVVSKTWQEGGEAVEGLDVETVDLGVANLAIGIKGDDGDSAYEVAVKNGFKGTESEWLESLKADATKQIEAHDKNPESHRDIRTKLSELEFRYDFLFSKEKSFDTYTFIYLECNLSKNKSYLLELTFSNISGDYVSYIGPATAESGNAIITNIQDKFRPEIKAIEDNNYRCIYNATVDSKFLYISFHSNFQISPDKKVTLKVYGVSPIAYKTDVEKLGKSIATDLYDIESVKLNKRKSKNLFNKTDVSSGFFSIAGDIQSNVNYYVSGYIPIDGDKTYHISHVQNNIYTVIYDKSFNIIKTLNTDIIGPTKGARFVRVSVYKNFLDNFQVEIGNVLTEYEPYRDFIISNDEIPKDCITNDKIKSGIQGEKILDYSISQEKCLFFESNNLFDKKASHNLGKYLNKNAKDRLSNSETYNTTDFIQIVPNGYICLSSSDKVVSPRMAELYDYNFQPVLDGYINFPETTIRASGNANYIRVTYYKSQWDDVQITKSQKPEFYEPYRIALKQDLVPNKSGSEAYKDITFFLPPHIYVASGRTIEIYYAQILLGAENYHIAVSTNFGIPLDRKLQIIGDSEHAGKDYNLTITAYDDLGKTVAVGKSIIHVVSNIIPSKIKVLPIADSLGNGKAWLAELNNLSSNITTVGTRGYPISHEGRSGATASFYNNIKGDAQYTYDKSYYGIGKDAPLFDEQHSYKVGDKTRITYTFGNGDKGYKVYEFIKNHLGPWLESDVYCISTAMPFYDRVKGLFSMAYYKTVYGIDYNVIVIFLGTNGISLDPDNNPNGALGIKELVNNIRIDEPTIPIVVVNTIFRSGQNGIGNQGNTDGYRPSSEYKFSADKKVLLLAKSVNKLLGNKENLYICPCGFTMDSKYAFINLSKAKKPVNPRIPATDVVYELFPSDSVHPEECGYMQIADELFSTLCYIINK